MTRESIIILSFFRDIIILSNNTYQVAAVSNHLSKHGYVPKCFRFVRELCLMLMPRRFKVRYVYGSHDAYLSQ